MFNIQQDSTWTATERIVFPEDKQHTWKHYVDARRIEVSCGEAPYLVSRYDTVSGESIELLSRIGLLDRKLRVVTENAVDDSEWLKWVYRAYESVYGFEFQGDNLLLARENLLYTFIDYMRYALKPNLPKLLYIGFKLSPQNPYRISICSRFFFSNICINDIIKAENYTYVWRNPYGIFSLLINVSKFIQR